MSRKGGEIWHAVIVRVLFFEIIIIFHTKTVQTFSPRPCLRATKKKKRKQKSDLCGNATEWRAPCTRGKRPRECRRIRVSVDLPGNGRSDVLLNRKNNTRNINKQYIYGTGDMVTYLAGLKRSVGLIYRTVVHRETDESRMFIGAVNPPASRSRLSARFLATTANKTFNVPVPIIVRRREKCTNF